MRQLLIWTVAVITALNHSAVAEEVLQNPVTPQGVVEVPPNPDQIEQVVYGAPGCCSCCEAKCGCTKYARIVCEMKKIPMHEWECECENVCTLVPAKRIGWSFPNFGKLFGCCDDAACSDECAAGCCEDGACDCERPKLGCCRVRRSPVMKEYAVEVPVYKCVVEYCCPNCGDPAAPMRTARLRRRKKTRASPCVSRLCPFIRRVTPSKAQIVNVSVGWDADRDVCRIGAEATAYRARRQFSSRRSPTGSGTSRGNSRDGSRERGWGSRGKPGAMCRRSSRDANSDDD
jgi:hypothetical protein